MTQTITEHVNTSQSVTKHRVNVVQPVKQGQVNAASIGTVKQR